MKDLILTEILKNMMNLRVGNLAEEKKMFLYNLLGFMSLLMVIEQYVRTCKIN